MTADHGITACANLGCPSRGECLRAKLHDSEPRPVLVAFFHPARQHSIGFDCFWEVPRAHVSES
jgi:hypothetical protein